MGKGNRSRTNRADEIIVNNGSKKKDAAQKTQKTTVLVTILVAVLIIACIAAYVVNSNGLIAKMKTAAKSDNVKVSGTMLSYYFNAQYQSFLNTYGSYASYFGLDTSKSLKSQKCNFSDAETWYDYFMNSTKEQVSEILCLYEAARAEGKDKLTEEEEQEITDALKSLKESAASNGYSLNGYISALYGNGVSVSDIKKCLELSTVASNYLSELSDGFKDAVTDEEIQNYIKEHKSSFYTADTLQYVFTASLTAAGAEATDEEKAAYEADKAAKKAEAEKLLAAATDAAAFKTWVANTLASDTDAIGDDFDSYWETASSKLDSAKKPSVPELEAAKKEAVDYIVKCLTTSEEVTAPKFEGKDYETEMTTAISSLYSQYITKGLDAIESNGITYSDPTDKDATDSAKFIFASDAAVGNVKVISNEGTSKSTYTVVFITATEHLDDSITKDVAHILITAATAGYDSTDTEKKNAASELAKAEAQKVLDEFNKGEKTLDAFEALGKEHTEDSNVIYRDVTEGEMVTAFNDWIFDSARKAGDTDIISTDYGWHIMYFIGDGNVVWKSNGISGVTSDKILNWYNEKVKTYNVVFNGEVVSSIG